MPAVSSRRREGSLSIETGSQPASAPTAQTENQGSQVPSEISSLANYMARQRASSAPAQESTPAGEGSPSTAATPPQDSREQYIPRSRFDEVLAERNHLRQQVQSSPTQPMAPPLQTGMTGYSAPQYPQPTGFPPTGMVGQAPPAQAAANVPDFNDPEVKKTWRKRISDDPVTGLSEFVSLLIEAKGAPMLEQFQQRINSQITPIQQSFVQQQLSSYANQRQQADPSFAQVAPTFTQLVGQAAQRGYPLTPQVLQAIEGIARAQTGMLTAPPQAPAQPVPFTENPGSAGSFGQPAEPALTPEERRIADRFRMSYAEYAASRRG